ncbi:amino acid adenylation domain-containing protein [Pectobacterium actinidiae]|uniref:non-ribosomal peptide synthetase n=1 Tax=Pectobacterium actinidiae TaxID=1507808 RepID=UPI0032EF698E
MLQPLPLTRISRQQALPLSADQYRIWFMHQLQPDLIHFNINMAFHLRGELQFARFQESLNAVVARHESLRTTFVMLSEEKQPQQCIHPQLTLDIPLTDLSTQPVTMQEQVAQEHMEAIGNQVFSLEHGPLLRAHIWRLTDEHHLLLFTIHHIIADFDSLKLIMRDLFAFYNQQGDTLAPLSLQYADYAAWQQTRLQSEEYVSQLEYWKNQLGGETPVLKMPMDRPRHSVMTNNGAIVRHTFSAELTEGLVALSKAQGVTLFVTLYSAWQVLLQRYTGQDDIPVGTPITTRNRPELRQLVGLFINTLVLKSDLQGNPDFITLLKRNRKIAFGAFARQDVPYEKLVEALKLKRNLSHNPFFQTMVMLLEAEKYDQLAPGLAIEPFEFKKRTTTFELTLTFSLVEQQLHLALDYNTDLYDRETVTRLLQHLDALMQGIVADPQRSIADYPIISERERHQLLTEQCRGPVVTDNLEHCVHRLFSDVVARTPNQIAVRHRQQQLSYQQLDERACQFARWLQSQGVGRGAIVGLVTERSLNMMVALLGILKAGAAWLPIDPANPDERIKYMLNNAHVSLVLLGEQVQLACQQPCFALEDIDSRLADFSRAPLLCLNVPDDLMYVIYTSGSTGQPKGVMVSHRNVVNHCANIIKRFDLQPHDRVLQFTSIGFDVSIQEIFPTLLRGATLVLWKEKRLEESGEFLSWTAREEISVMNLTTAHWNNIVADLRHSRIPVPDHLKVVIVGGEQAAGEVWNNWQQLTRGSIRWINDYGLTETTVTASMFEPSADYVACGAMPVGTALDNVEIYILDSQMQPLPVGVFGSLYIGGAGVAMGYINQPELTEERFLTNPFASGKLFKTGDQARWRRDGLLEFAGRDDQQVKIRGHRVELAEVESMLTKHASVKKALVLAQETAHGGQQLVSWLVVDQATYQEAALREWLTETLPDYMVPASLVTLDSIPLTVNGKVDKTRLPAPVFVAESGEAFQAPQSAIAQMLAECWQLLLQRPAVGLQDNFFAIGGDSLLATQVATHIKARIQHAIPLRLLFEYPRLGDLAHELERIIAEGQSVNDRCMVKIQQKGSQTPLFYVHPVGGNVSCYFTLARHLGENQPFYALQSHALIDPNSPYDTVESMAAFYLNEIRQIQPHGPYRLGGWSMGGFIAYEIARLLQEAGEAVQELSMIDTYLTKSRVSTDEIVLFNFVLQLAAVPGRKIDEEMLLAWQGKSYRHEDVCQQLRAHGLVPQGTSDAEIQRLLDVYTHTVHAFKRYQPQPTRKLALDRVVLFRARDSHEELGVWEQLVERVDLHHVDADHFGIVHHPKVGDVLRQTA